MDIPKKLDLKFQEIADPRSLGILERVLLSLNSLVDSVKKIKVEFPTLYRIYGDVNIEDMPPVKVSNFPDLNGDFRNLAKTIEEIQVKTLKALNSVEFVVPDSFKIKDKVKIENWDELIEGVEELKKGFNILINQDKKGTEGIPMEVAITNFPPQMVPQPVTSININPLRGFVKSTSVTVSTTLTPLPGTALANRRGVVLYNNGSNTVFIGGSDVTSSNGTPVPASTFSPALDIGPRMIVYGVTSSSSSDMRVLELSNDDVGGNH